MTNISSEPLGEVLSKYNINVLGIKNESFKDKKGVWWIQTSEGLKILKKISNSENTLNFTISAINHLIKNSVNIPKINKTKFDTDYVKINDICYVLFDAIEGKNPSYDYQLPEIAKALAKFHRASKGFSPNSASKPKNHLGIWVDDYLNQIENMNSFYLKEINSDYSNDVGKFIINEFPYFYNIAKNVINNLDSKEYWNWVEKIKISGGLCHQDFAAGNLLINSSGLFVLDTDSITIDIPARDLRKLFNKIMKKKGEWDLNVSKKIIYYYQLENHLTLDEWKVVKYDISFPHLFIGAMNKYYYQRDREWSQNKYLERIKEMSTFEKTKKTFLENFDYLLPKELL